MRARRGWAAGLLAGAAGLAAVGPVLLGTALSAGAATAKCGRQCDVAVVNNTFSPNYVNINPGDRVLWTNQDDKTVHSVTSDKGSATFDADLGKRGATFEKRFDTPGSYTYHCKYHASMVGTIDVGTPATTTTTTAPPTTTTATTAPPTTTTTAPATTTTVEPTTTTTAPRPAAGPVPVPPVPNSAAAPPPPSSTTTLHPSTTTTTTARPTTATSAPPVLAGGEAPAPPPAPATPPTSAGKAGDSGGKIPTAAGPPVAPGGDLDVGAIALVSALVAVGAFAAWTLIRVRPGRI